MFRAGVDLGGTKIQVVVVDSHQNVKGQFRCPTPSDGGPSAVNEAIANAFRSCLADAEVDSSQIIGIGVGSPGKVDRAAGTVTDAVNLPAWMFTYPLAVELTTSLGLHVTLGNDVQSAVMAEAQSGAGRGYDSIVGVFWGTGVGGGLIINDELWVGRGAAGEIGHMCVQTKDGALCSCGRLGCVEAYAGRASMEATAKAWVSEGEATTLFTIMAAKGRDRLTSGVWAKALEKNDAMAERLINRAIWALGSGIASIVNLLDIEAVIIGGGLGLRLGEPYVERIRDAMTPHLFKNEDPPAIHLATLGDLGGAIGAAMLVEGSRHHRIAVGETTPH